MIRPNPFTEEILQWTPLSRIENEVEALLIVSGVMQVCDAVCRAWVSTQPMELTQFVAPNVF
jgi:hypothetical protein